MAVALMPSVEPGGTAHPPRSGTLPGPCTESQVLTQASQGGSTLRVQEQLWGPEDAGTLAWAQGNCLESLEGEAWRPQSQPQPHLCRQGSGHPQDTRTASQSLFLPPHTGNSSNTTSGNGCQGLPGAATRLIILQLGGHYMSVVSRGLMSLMESPVSSQARWQGCWH